MEKKEKKKLFGNIILLLLVVALIIVAVVLWRKSIKENENQEQEEVVLRDVGYNSEIEHFGYKDAQGVTDAFISSFEQLSGEKLASMYNMGGAYMYSYLEDKLKKDGVATENLYQEILNKFDAQYEEAMKDPSQFEDFVLMQYDMAAKEREIINGMPATCPNLKVVGTPEIEDLTKYLSKIDLSVLVTSEVENIHELDTVELLLLHRDDAYFLMNFTTITSVPTTNET